MQDNRITTVFGSIKKIHMIGIGGIGMSGIADVMIRLGFIVSGSDTTETSITRHLRSLGATIDIGHHRDHIISPDVVVYSSAIKEDNPEFRQARNNGIKLIRRAEFLGMLLSVWPIRIGVAGTHGKTSTSSIIASALDACGSHPSMFIGGIIKNLQTNARMDSKTYVIFEADEYDRTFLALPPTLAVITNVDADHLDIYKDLQDMKDTFLAYANSVPENGSVILCYDDDEARSLLPMIDRPYVSYGTKQEADFRISDISYDTGSHFTLSYKNDKIGVYSIDQVGLHNVFNATAALVTAYLLHLDMKSAGEGIKAFAGVERRFELRHQSDDVLFYDDYAHHPTEINATLTAVRILHPDRRILAIFQPHLFSRTKDFADNFARSLHHADKVFLADIYPAREKPIPGVDSKMIIKLMKEQGFEEVYYAGKLKDVHKIVLPQIKKNDIVMTIGAGDIWQVSDKLYKEFNVS
ncbi:MAG: UDP-N-acetylmuramate--L-alanine ligase [Candidatus Marinimicrobia bacterium]|nr:UDP-N-acetylmuramate--L-alanine ligase [Candidatus Neomarinimicrobiota bacterium]